MTPAAQHLDGLMQEAQEKNTLAAWRLKNEEAVSIIKDFAQTPDWSSETDIGSCEKEVQECLFRPLNRVLWDQERSKDPELETMLPRKEELAVVFGGKYSTLPDSISETVVRHLAASCRKVLTVSRSEVVSLPDNVTHIVKQNLDQKDNGVGEFVDVLRAALAAAKGSMMTIYFTLGQHKGFNPFVRNITAAQNFALALRELKDDFSVLAHRIVVTGTDATKASSSPDSTLSVDGCSYNVPTYKIMKYNFVYAMSKLCQLYIIANAVYRNKKNEAIKSSITSRIQQMVHCVAAAGENGNYDENGGITMQELDDISNDWIAVLSELSPHLAVAEGISICYTPLHRTPWTQQALSKSSSENVSPKAYLIEQVVRRLKNAISVEKAARLHFPALTGEE